MRIHHCLGICLLLSSSVSMAQESETAAPLPIATPVMTQPLPEFPGKEVMLLSIEFPPGAVDPVHRHDAEAFVYVLEGSIVMGVAGGEEVVLGPGDTFRERPEDLHTVGRNASAKESARFLAFLIKDTGKPAVIPAN